MSSNQIPYPDNSIEYINSLCIIEHIGLGRYCDPVDSQGVEKTILELRRVMHSGGSGFIGSNWAILYCVQCSSYFWA
jgi:hypothetical protein